MKSRTLIAVLCSSMLLSSAVEVRAGSTRAAGTTLTLDVARSGPSISPTLFGLMFEDINHAGDGGLYAELIANRNLMANPPALDDWWTVRSAHAQGDMQLDLANPVNALTLPASLRIHTANVSPGERVGTANDGYFGIPVRPSTTYHASFYARRDAEFAGPLTVGIEGLNGHVYAQAGISSLSTSWHHYTLTLTTAAGIKPTQETRFVITGAHRGTFWLSLVSLFPPTYNNRANGLRPDLMRDLQALNPGFLRFPGGNFLEGNTVDTRFNWENTLGPISGRAGHFNDAWGYYSTDGLGLLEYLLWCEDLHVVPVLAVYAGYSLGGEHVEPGAKLAPYVRSALNELQYATGAPSTPWGARRVADGHPAPFAVPYVEVGNEDWFDQSGSYDDRFAQFYDAIKHAYPAIKVIATTDVTTRNPDLIDQHFYHSPQWFTDNAGLYDGYSRTAPKVMVGEYAAQPSDDQIAKGRPIFANALGEAAWMTGLERNADVVKMAAYAPLFRNENAYQWSPDLIGFDGLHSYGSPSYYVQQLFGRNHGDRVVPTTLAGASGLQVVASKVAGGHDLYLIVVNTGAATTGKVAIRGSASIASTATATTLTGSSDAENTLRAPTAVVPHTTTLHHIGPEFSYTFGPHSITVLHLTAAGL